MAAGFPAAPSQELLLNVTVSGMAGPKLKAKLQKNRVRISRWLDRWLRVESLEACRVLAATLYYPGQDVEVKRGGDSLRLVESADNSNLLEQLDVASIDDRQLEINTAAFRVDSDMDLAGNDLLVFAESIVVASGGLLNAGEVVLSAVGQFSLIGNAINDDVLRGLVASRNRSRFAMPGFRRTRSRCRQAESYRRVGVIWEPTKMASRASMSANSRRCRKSVSAASVR